MAEKRRFVEDDLAVEKEIGKEMFNFGKKQTIKEIRKIMCKLVKSGSGDISYWELDEQIKKLEKRK